MAGTVPGQHWLKPPGETMHANLDRQAAELLESLSPAGGMAECAMEGIRFLRGVDLADFPARGPVMIIGRLHATEAAYAPLRCLVLPSALSVVPPGCAVVSAIQIDIDLKVAAELLVLAGADLPVPAAHHCDQLPVCLGAEQCETLLRLLAALRIPVDAKVLGPGLVRELLYRVLVGPQGGAVHVALAQHRHVCRIGKALRKIHAHYDMPVNVPMLAGEAGMSITAFHSHFKALTMTTPMQYLKSTRLRHAKLMMARDGVSAAYASRMVGYESCSQFSREFKRFFGRSPGREALALKAMLTPVRQQPSPIILESGTV
ncbi:AraC family transcriptional regulator [Pseudoduganella plicata]|nr:AraC family transcriptional regulator [Pseudoduganella plicata]